VYDVREAMLRTTSVDETWSHKRWVAVASGVAAILITRPA
jgi:hypothetical protein